MSLRQRVAPDLLLVALLLAGPLLMFHQQTLGERTLLPSENLYQHLPYSAYRDVVKAPAVPHNHLLSDMVLQNYQWKQFIRAQIAGGEIPLWNPHVFAGAPFFAAGQHSALYPLSAIYYILPLSAAYGWFVVVNLWLAGVFMAGYMRAIGVNRAGAALAGLVYQLSGFMIAGAVFPMMLAAAVWLPLILWMIENILRGRSPGIFRGSALIWVAIGAVAVCCNVLAGHIELTIYTLLIAGYYAAFRLIWLGIGRWRMTGRAPLGWLARMSIWLALLVILGLGLSALQLIPLYEFAQSNWRAERSSLETVLGYAHAPRDLLQFLLPNFYGNPTHVSYTDALSGALVTELRNAAGQPIDRIDWGVKNYVEGALYLGVLPLALAVYAFIAGLRRRAEQVGLIILFALLALIALSFMFGLPSYSWLYRLPGMNQLNTPFRWVYALSLAVAALAGLGLHLLARRDRLALFVGGVLLIAGLTTVGALAFVHASFDELAPIFDWFVAETAHADGAFADGRMFYSYQLPQVRILAALLLASGVVFLLAAWRRGRFLALLALVISAADLLAASYGFNPASDPALLDFRPPAVEYLQGQAGHFRVTSLERPGDGRILHPNTTVQFGLDDIRGYDSIIPASFVATMRALQPQHLLDFNQISSLSTAPELNHGGYQRTLMSDLLSLFNVRYVLTAPDVEMRIPGWTEVYRQEVAIWENAFVMPRAFAVDKADWAPRWLAEMGGGFNFGELGILAGGLKIERYAPAAITHDSGREKMIDVGVDSDSWLVVSETYMPGWRAFARPRGSGEDREFGLGGPVGAGEFSGGGIAGGGLDGAAGV